MNRLALGPGIATNAPQPKPWLKRKPAFLVPKVRGTLSRRRAEAKSIIDINNFQYCWVALPESEMS